MLEAQRRGLGATAAMMNVQLEQTKAALDRLQREYDRVKQQGVEMSGELRNLTDTLATVRQELTDKTAHADNLRTELTALTEAHAALQSRCDAAEAQNVDLTATAKRQLDSIVLTMSTLDDVLLQREEANVDRKLQQRRYKKLKDKRDGDVAKLAKQDDMMASMNTAADRAASYIRQLNAKVDALKTQLELREDVRDSGCRCHVCITGLM